ncbi:MAG: hypothetical protein HY854_12860 [Burkholderiales bacterium]|nr:hypothetical protein [Burkholderiales bacterium]
MEALVIPGAYGLDGTGNAIDNWYAMAQVKTAELNESRRTLAGPCPTVGDNATV